MSTKNQSAICEESLASLPILRLQIPAQRGITGQIPAQRGITGQIPAQRGIFWEYGPAAEDAS
jgi:hypothetical protein